MTLSFVAFPSLCKSLKSCRTRKTQTDITWHAGWWVHQKEEGHTQETVTDWCVMLDKIRRWEGQREENEEEDEKTKRMRQRIKSRTESLRNFFLFRPLLETQGKLASTLVIFEQNKRWNQSKWGFECFSKLAQLEQRLSGWKKKNRKTIVVKRLILFLIRKQEEQARILYRSKGKWMKVGHLFGCNNKLYKLNERERLNSDPK